MQKNSAPINKRQKLLLKVLTCLFNQYVSKQTGVTRAFFANPNSEDTYNKMFLELKSLAAYLNVNEALNKLSTKADPDKGINEFIPYVRFVATDAMGVVAVDTSKDVLVNTYSNYLDGVISDNHGTRKPWQILNTNESLQRAYQVKPSKNHDPAKKQCDGSFVPTFVTEGRIIERTGCNGVSNTGFLAMSIEVDINLFPFDTCSNSCHTC
jgi:hypothetical protein